MPEEEGLAKRLVDLAVYVPAGILASITEDLPSLARKGREQLEGQINLARTLGQLALKEAERRLSAVLPESVVAGSPPPADPSDAPSPDPAGQEPAKAPPLESPPPAELSIPGYDALAASQVVKRLASLDDEELEAVRCYETATRQRRTILHKIAQLQAPGLAGS